jgi:hypothetical protein
MTFIIGLSAIAGSLVALFVWLATRPKKVPVRTDGFTLDSKASPDFMADVEQMQVQERKF